MDILKEKDYLLRACTVNSLGKLGDDKAIVSLASTLNDESYFVRVNAANALGMIGDNSALPYLESALENSKGESQEFENSLKNAIEKINTHK
jgi:HEAT repeat protein